MNQDSTVKEDELWPQDQTQAADETQIQAAEELDPMTVHLVGNCKFHDGVIEISRTGLTNLKYA